jgi:hypothetical protein
MRLALTVPVLATLVFATGVAQAAPPGQDPDWPCVQRLMPRLAASTYWTGPAPKADWHADPAISALVTEIAPRTVPADAAVAKLQQFTAGLPADGKPDRLAELFAGLVEETNRQRDQIIDRLHDLTRRQREVTSLVTAVTGDLSHETDPAKHDEMVQRRSFLLREFDSVQRTVRYACEAPVQLEARLGSLGRALDAALP